MKCVCKHIYVNMCICIKNIKYYVDEVNINLYVRKRLHDDDDDLKKVILSHGNVSIKDEMC